MERRFDQLGGTIGRAAGNDLELPDPGKYISRNHSKIDFAEGRYTLMDLGANPSWINDRPVGAGKTASLEHGDRLMIGDYVLEVLVERPGAAAVPVFEPETSAELPFQAQPAAPPSPHEGPSFDELRDTLAGVKILDVAGGFDPLAAPSANDPLGLNMLGGAEPMPLAQQPAAFRGSEPDHVSPQFIPMPGALLPGHAAAPQPAAYVPESPPVSPYSSEPTVLTIRATQPPQMPGMAAAPPPSMLIPDDYDPLADFLPPRVGAQAPAQGGGWQQPVPALGQGAQGWPEPGGMPSGGQAGYPGQAGASAGSQPAWPAHAATPPSAPAGWPQPPVHGGAPAGWPASPLPPAGAPGWPQPAAAVVYPSAGGDEVLQALLRGMGLSGLQLKKSPAETAELAGMMLREATAGTMAVLMARAMTKRESRLEMTVLGAQANNPLKFFPDAESALSQMLTNALSGYMPPVKSIGSAFEDLKAHELAVIAGMRAALDGVMARFNPALIEAKEPEGVMDKMMVNARKARMWDRMVELYDDILREADDDFQHLFGEKFSAAYEEQIGRLHRK
ncbi:type VI secretion system-associated FHA domain protein TagH [Pseudoduganella namucuonensis]|uniref:type VI secretion system-associated FHA domain protein TagH n=1 Tax=Pseudoduganella namucuonensis TaxID=1035707 RepID=UPI0015A4FCCC|nr:type VI secretion system-associated FHA domain protein TagH [Pseudoduganella namucuonensis]